MAVQSALKQAAVAVPVTPPLDVLPQVERQHGLWHRGVHFVASEVRDYELDQFQVRKLLLLLHGVSELHHQPLHALSVALTSE